MAAAQNHGFSNAAAVLHGIDDLRFEDFPLAPKPGEGMVRIEMKAVGICGSDGEDPRTLSTILPAFHLRAP